MSRKKPTTITSNGRGPFDKFHGGSARVGNISFSKKGDPLFGDDRAFISSERYHERDHELKMKKLDVDAARVSSSGDDFNGSMSGGIPSLDFLGTMEQEYTKQEKNMMDNHLLRYGVITYKNGRFHSPEKFHKYTKKLRKDLRKKQKSRHKEQIREYDKKLKEHVRSQIPRLQKKAQYKVANNYRNYSEANVRKETKKAAKKYYKKLKREYKHYFK